MSLRFTPTHQKRYKKLASKDQSDLEVDKREELISLVQANTAPEIYSKQPISLAARDQRQRLFDNLFDGNSFGLGVEIRDDAVPQDGGGDRLDVFDRHVQTGPASGPALWRRGSCIARLAAPRPN